MITDKILTHIYIKSKTCVPMAESKTDPVIIFATHTHTYA